MKWTPLKYIDTESGWILNTADNLQGYPFIASLFKRFPTVVESSDLPASFVNSYFADGIQYVEGLAGFDALVLGNIAKKFNFRTKILNSGSYGVLLPNNTFTGKIYNGIPFCKPEVKTIIFFRIHWRCSISKS